LPRADEGLSAKSSLPRAYLRTLGKDWRRLASSVLCRGPYLPRVGPSAKVAVAESWPLPRAHYKNSRLLWRLDYDDNSLFSVTVYLQWLSGYRHRRWVTNQLLWPSENIVINTMTIVLLSLMQWRD
jgi:hypothetical protein